MSARRRPADAEVAAPSSGSRLVVRPLAEDLAIAAGSFGGVTLLAEALGAANLGTAMGFGQIAFGVAVVALILRRA